MLGSIDVYKPELDGELTKVDHIDIGYSIDNLSVDARGDVYAAVLPYPLRFFQSSMDPYNITPPSTVFKIRITSSGYNVTKAIEDKFGEVLPGTTTAVHDAKTGRLFMSGMSISDVIGPLLTAILGIFSPFITVCEPN